MRNRLSPVLIGLGAALILAACGLMIYNQIDNYLVGQRSQRLLEQMMEQILSGEYDEAALSSGSLSNLLDQHPALQAPQPTGLTGGTGAPGDWDDEDEEGGGEITAVKAGPYVPPNYNTLGILVIPALNLKLPVLEDCTNALLKVSICRIAGTADNTPKRLVIAGHNLKNHFAGLHGLVVGDLVNFITRDGTVLNYTVTEVGECHRDNPEEVQAGVGWDMTLVTCKSIRTMRTLIRCKEIPAPQPETPQPEPQQDQPQQAEPEQTLPQQTEPQQTQQQPEPEPEPAEPQQAGPQQEEPEQTGPEQADPQPEREQ